MLVPWSSLGKRQYSEGCLDWRHRFNANRMIRLQIQVLSIVRNCRQCIQRSPPGQQWAPRDALPHALDRPLRRHLEPDEFRRRTHELHQSRHRNPTAARRYHHGCRRLRELCRGLALQIAKVVLAERCEDLVHTHPCALSNLLVEIDERPSQHPRQCAAGTRLPGARNADEHEMRSRTHVSRVARRPAPGTRAGCGAVRPASRRRTSRPSHQPSPGPPWPRRSLPSPALR